MEDLKSKIAVSPRARFGKGVSEDVIVAAEQALGIQFPRSYRTWLREYGAGYIGSYELQGLCPIPLNERDPDIVYVGDVVDTTRSNRKAGAPDHLIELLNLDGDEIYYLDLSRAAGGEAPVVCQVAGAETLADYAPTFRDFLVLQL